MNPVVINEEYNPYHDCIQGLANQPITVTALLEKAAQRLPKDSIVFPQGDFSPTSVVERLVRNSPRVCIIGGAADHPAHLLDEPHALMAAAAIWNQGGVPFLFHIPVICDGTAQNNIGQSYSLASRNHTASAVNITFEGHSYHAAYVLAGCDKSPMGILSGLASADMARNNPDRKVAPVWALFAPSHVLRGGVIPPGVQSELEAVAARAKAAGHDDIEHDLLENTRYILQCSSDEAFAGIFRRAIDLGLMAEDESRTLLNRLAAATCHKDGGVCAFNGTGNSTRTVLSAMGMTVPELELLTGLPAPKAVNSGIRHLFGMFNKPEFRVTEIMRRNYRNAAKLHSATGSSSNMLLHITGAMRYAGFDISIHDYDEQRKHGVPEVFAHSLTEKRDTFVLAQQFEQGKHKGMLSFYKVLVDLGVELDLDAPTVTGRTWLEMMGDEGAVTPVAQPEENMIIRTGAIRDTSGIDILSGNFFSSAAVKISGMSDEHLKNFRDRYFVVRFYENEHLCNADFADSKLADKLAEPLQIEKDLLEQLAARNGVEVQEGSLLNQVKEGVLSLAFIIAGQGPKAYGMPEMFSPSQNLRHHGWLEPSSILITDGRYSGVTKGACIGHMVPEAYDGGQIGYLKDGDILRVNLDSRELTLMDRDAFVAGELKPLQKFDTEERAAIFAGRKERMEDRLLGVAAANVMDYVTDAETGVVPHAVNRRAKRNLD